MGLSRKNMTLSISLSCEEFYLRMKVITLADRYIELIFSELSARRGHLFYCHRQHCKNSEEHEEVKDMKNKLDDEYRAKLLRAITDARTEKPFGDTQSELDTIARHISNRIALLQCNAGNTDHDLKPGPLVAIFYKEYYHKAIRLALEPIDIGEIKNHYDELLTPFRTGPIRPFSCINMKLDDMKLNN